MIHLPNDLQVSEILTREASNLSFDALPHRLHRRGSLDFLWRTPSGFSDPPVILPSDVPDGGGEPENN
jgi:hypothetical protein